MSPRMQRIAAQKAAVQHKKDIQNIAIAIVAVPVLWFVATIVLVGAGYAI